MELECATESFGGETGLNVVFVIGLVEVGGAFVSGLGNGTMKDDFVF